jgi:lysophospholipid acyltransferase (LPLAT)-like uncharacterized protein
VVAGGVTANAYPWWTGPGAATAVGALRVLGATWRVSWVRADERAARIARGERCIFAFWHSRILPLAYAHRGRDVGALISQHRDGELIARVVERLGYRAARGSSTRGGDEGVREMLAFAEDGRLIALTPDGPRGPAERVKPGLVYLASRTGWPVVPVGCGISSAWVLRSWDRFRIPRPFARVAVVYGETFAVPGGLDDASTETWRARLENALHAAGAEARALVGEPA